MDVVLLYLSAALGAVTVGTVLSVELLRIRALLSLRWPREIDLDYYELAYLAGGPTRVIHTAVGLLAREGELRVSRGGMLHKVKTAVSAGFRVEDAVLTAVAERRGGIPVRKLGLGRSAEVVEIGDRLVFMGLLVDPQRMPSFRVLRQLLRLIPLVAVAAMVGNLVMMAVFGSPQPMVVSLLAFGGSYVVAKGLGRLYTRSRPVTLSRAGRRLLAAARRTHPHGVVTDAVAMPLALYGLSHLGDPKLAAEIGKRSTPDGHLYPARIPDTGGGGCGGGGCGGGCGGGGGGS